MSNLRIFAIDLGANTGWAGHPLPGDNRPNYPRHGSFRLVEVFESNYGPMLANLRSRLIDKLFATPVMMREDHLRRATFFDMDGQRALPAYDEVWYEAAVPFGGKKGSTRPTNLQAIRQQLHRGAMVEFLCTEIGVPCYEENMATVRKHFLGHGRPEDPKEEVMAVCRTYGWYPDDHDCGDALALFDYACHMGKQPFPRHAGALFKPQVRL